MVFVDSIRGNMKRVVNEQVDSSLLPLGFQYVENEGALSLVGILNLRGETIRATIVNNHQLYIEVFDYDEYRYSKKYSYEFNESTSFLGIIEDAVRKINR